MGIIMESPTRVKHKICMATKLTLHSQDDDLHVSSEVVVVRIAITRSKGIAETIPVQNLKSQLIHYYITLFTVIGLCLAFVHLAFGYYKYLAI